LVRNAPRSAAASNIADNPEDFELREMFAVQSSPISVCDHLIEPERIVILSVFHTSRDQKQLKFRR
jgi:hypothetical protein